MEITLLARQAIYDQHLNAVSYELLFRDGKYNIVEVDKVDETTVASTINWLSN